MRNNILKFSTSLKATPENWKNLVEVLFGLYSEGFKGLYFSPLESEHYFEICFIKKPDLERGSIEEKISEILASTGAGENRAIECKPIAFIPLHANYKSFANVLWKMVQTSCADVPNLADVIKPRLDSKLQGKLILDRLLSLVIKHKAPKKLARTRNQGGFFGPPESLRTNCGTPFDESDIRNSNLGPLPMHIKGQEEILYEHNAEIIFDSEFKLFKENVGYHFSMLDEKEFFEILKLLNSKDVDNLKTFAFEHGPLVDGLVKDDNEVLVLNFVLKAPLLEILSRIYLIGATFLMGEADADHSILKEFLTDCASVIVANLKKTLELAHKCLVNVRTGKENLGFQIVFQNYPCSQVTEKIFAVIASIMMRSGFDDYFRLELACRGAPQKMPAQAEQELLEVEKTPVEVLEKKLNTTTSLFFGKEKTWKTFPRDRLEARERDHVVKFLVIPKEEAQQKEELSACLSQNQFCLLKAGQSRKGDPFVVVDLTLTAGKK